MDYRLTGEDEVFYGRITPNKPWNKSGGYGSWEVLGRFSAFQAEKEPFVNLDRQNGSTTSYATSPVPTSTGTGSATHMTNWMAGLNWTPVSNVKILFNYGENYYGGGDYVGALGADIRGTERFVIFSTQMDF